MKAVMEAPGSFHKSWTSFRIPFLHGSGCRIYIHGSPIDFPHGQYLFNPIDVYSEP